MCRRFEGCTAGSMNIPPHEGLGVILADVLAQWCCRLKEACFVDGMSAALVVWVGLGLFKHDCEHLEGNVWMGSGISVSVAGSGICHAVFAADVHLYIIIMACSHDLQYQPLFAV